MKRIHMPHKLGLFNNPISVRSPVDTKKSGRNNASETSSTFSVMIFRNLIFSGMTTPAMNAPNSACNPNISVRYADAISKRNMKATNPLSITSLL